MLDGMHNELNRVVRKPKYESIDCDKEPISKQSEIWARYFRARDNSIITDIFEGQLCSAITCKKCGYQSLTFDNFMDLSLSMPKRSFSFSSLDLTECLQNFIEPENMESCGYRCAKCKKVDNMTKDFSVFRFPPVLVIHLKRFSRREKLSTSVSIPKTLDMRPYAPHSCK